MSSVSLDSRMSFRFSSLVHLSLFGALFIYFFSLQNITYMPNQLIMSTNMRKEPFHQTQKINF